MATALPRFFVILKNCLTSGKNSSNLSAAQHSKHNPNRLIWDEYISVASVDFLLYIFFKFSICACSQVVFTLDVHPN